MPGAVSTRACISVSVTISTHLGQIVGVLEGDVLGGLVEPIEEDRLLPPLAQGVDEVLDRLVLGPATPGPGSWPARWPRRRSARTGPEVVEEELVDPLPLRVLEELRGDAAVDRVLVAPSWIRRDSKARSTSTSDVATEQHVRCPIGRTCRDVRGAESRICVMPVWYGSAATKCENSWYLTSLYGMGIDVEELGGQIGHVRSMEGDDLDGQVGVAVVDVDHPLERRRRATWMFQPMMRSAGASDGARPRA